MRRAVTMMRTGMAAAILGVAALASADEPSLDKLLASHSPQEHAAMAERLERDAAEALAKVELHRKMGEQYKRMGGAATGKLSLDEHCAKLVKHYQEVQKELLAMAQLHRRLSQEPRGTPVR